MVPTSYLGEFEELVLLAIRKVGKGAYGVLVLQALNQALKPQRSVSIGALYTTFHRMTAKGLVRSKPSRPTKKRGGRSKSLLSLTRQGSNALKRTESVRQKLHS